MINFILGLFADKTVVEVAQNIREKPGHWAYTPVAIEDLVKNVPGFDPEGVEKAFQLLHGGGTIGVAMLKGSRKTEAVIVFLDTEGEYFSLNWVNNLLICRSAYYYLSLEDVVQEGTGGAVSQ